MRVDSPGGLYPGRDCFKFIAALDKKRGALPVVLKSHLHGIIGRRRARHLG